MRTLAFLLLFVLPACRDKDPYADAPAHPGEPTVYRRSPRIDSLPPEARFLDRLVTHQQVLAALVRDAASHDLSAGTRRRIERAAMQHQRYQAALRTASRRYPGSRPPTNPPKVAGGDQLKQLRGSDYESALVRALLASYRGEVALIDSFLPQLNAEVKGFAKEMRSQRRHEIQSLTRAD